MSESSSVVEGAKKTRVQATSNSSIQIEPGWLQYLQSEFSKEYMIKLKAFLQAQRDQKKAIFPKGKEYFAAFNTTPLDQVEVVILGQDPYHGPGQAHGLSFSVPPGVKPPPSLLNIFKELATDLNIDKPEHGHLESWAKQGVLLLNSVLTVECRRAGSHAGQGWEEFTDRAIQIINETQSGVVFLLWGSYAQKKAAFVDRQKHLVLKSPHPSPLSAHRGFFGCKHFSKANEYLSQKGRQPIDWRLPKLQ